MANDKSIKTTIEITNPDEVAAIERIRADKNRGFSSKAAVIRWAMRRGLQDIGAIKK